MKHHYVYTCWDQTPLKWHKFITYFSLPVAVIIYFCMIPSHLESINLLRGTGYAWLGVFDLLYLLSIIGLSIGAFVGNLKRTRKWSGPKCTIAIYGVAVFYGAVCSLISLWLDSYETIVDSSVTVITYGISLPLLVTYYRKRRLLFSPVPAKEGIQDEVPVYGAEPLTDMQKNRDVPAPSFDRTAQTEPQYCRTCGKKLPDGSRFCPYCDQTVYSERPDPFSCTEEEGTKPGKKKWIALGVVAVLLIAAIALCVILLGSNDAMGEQSPVVSGNEENAQPKPDGTPTFTKQAQAYSALYDWVEENYNETWTDGSVSYWQGKTDDDWQWDFDVMVDEGELLLRCEVTNSGGRDLVYMTLVPEGTEIPVSCFCYDPADAESYSAGGVGYIDASVFAEDSIVCFEEVEGATTVDVEYMEDVAPLLCKVSLLFCDDVLHEMSSETAYTVQDLGFTSFSYN